MLLEDDTTVYIVRVWLERREFEDALVEWRGSIEHVASGTIAYFTHLDEIPQFIQNYLTEKGVSFPESAE